MLGKDGGQQAAGAAVRGRGPFCWPLGDGVGTNGKLQALALAYLPCPGAGPPLSIDRERERCTHCLDMVSEWHAGW